MNVYLPGTLRIQEQVGAKCTGYLSGGDPGGIHLSKLQDSVQTPPAKTCLHLETATPSAGMPGAVPVGFPPAVRPHPGSNSRFSRSLGIQLTSPGSACRITGPLRMES